MSKPTVFFSHSSKDSQPLARLKDRFVSATGGSIDIFLSSDGQSIPLGRNWVHRIEEALISARLMFIFVTANSLRSKWIFFESGFAYSKGIRVIPIGFLGADLAELAPPLSLLQGFNIRSEEGLNNIIAVVNDEFTHKHQPSFTIQDFKDIVGVSAEGGASPFGEYGRFVRDIRVVRSRDEGTRAISWNSEEYAKETRKELAEALNVDGVPYEASSDSFEIQGANITIRRSSRELVWEMHIDPGTAEKNIEIASKLAVALRGPETRGMYITFEFAPSVYCEGRSHIISGKLSGIASLAPNLYFRYGDLEFKATRELEWAGAARVLGPACLVVGSRTSVPSLGAVRDIICALFEKGILHFDQDPEVD